MTVCVTCGLPKELCVCESIAKESLKIIVKVVEKKFNKKYTVVEGADQKEIDIVGLAKQLKARLACGGTVKDGKIELQGDHKQKVKQVLIEAGFAPETVVVR